MAISETHPSRICLAIEGQQLPLCLSADLYRSVSPEEVACTNDGDFVISQWCFRQDFTPRVEDGQLVLFSASSLEE